MNTTRVFRLFISSTFSDFIAEREALQKNVFPKLEQYCAERGAQFQAIDLRWGITEQAQREHNTLRICLEEVRRCQQLSPRPNFAVLLGDRYGWEPVPARIPFDHWKRLQINATPEHWNLISSSYRLDENAIPSVYCLKERSDDDDKAFQHESQLLEALRQAAAGFRGNDRLPYFTSATHQEIVLGAMSKRDADGQKLNPKGHVHVYDRSLEGMPTDISAKDFIDWNSNLDQVVPGACQRMQNLKNQLRRQLGDHYHELKSTWSRHGKNGAVNQAYLQRFCDLFLEHQIELIDAEIATLEQIDDRQQREHLHQDFGDERARVFAGRKPLLAKIARYTNDDLPLKSGQTKSRSKKLAPLILIGGGGSGKSALLARAAQETVQRIKPSRAVVLQRYIGGVPGTESLLNTVSLLSADIATYYGHAEPPIAQNADDLAQTFEAVLGYATPRRPLILFLDALDQLDSSDRAWMLEWLPDQLPDHVRIVASIRSDTAVEQAARRRFSKQIINVPRLKPSEGRAILKAWLADKRESWFNAGITPSTGRRLTKEQESKVLSAFDQNGLALWLKIVYQEASTWSSWHTPRDLPFTIHDLIHDIADQKLLVQEQHPKIFTERALAYLTASRFGLAENEIGRALGRDRDVRVEFQENEKTQRKWDDDQSLPPIMWSRLFFDLQAYLGFAQIDGKILMRWFHREFDDVFKARYLATNDDRKTIHGVLADAFLALDRETRPTETNDDAFFKASDVSQKPISAALRRIMEQPWQLAQAGRAEDLEHLVSDFGFCMGKCAANRSADLASDMLLNRRLRGVNSNDGSPGQQAKAFESFVLGQQHLLRRGNETWSAHRILLQLASQQSPQTEIRKSCETWLKNKLDDWLWIKSTDRISDAEGILTLEGHEGSFTSFVAAELLGGRLISRHADYRVWNLDTGKSESVYTMDDRPLVIACSPNRKFDAPRAAFLDGWSDLLWAIGQNEIRFWKNGWEGVSVCEALETSDGRIALRDDDRNNIALIDLNAGSEPQLRLKGHTGEIHGFAECADGSLVSWSADASLRFWNLETGACRLTLDSHEHPVLGVMELPGQHLLSWDDHGCFVLTNYANGNSQSLEGLPSHDSDLDYRLDGRLQIGALLLPENNPAAFLAWNRDHLNWYDEDGHLLTSCENDNIEGIAWIDGVGVARAIGNEITITSDAGEEIAQTEEDDAFFISGLLKMPNNRLITWTGYKGGDDTLRVWAPEDGDWEDGIDLKERVETRSRWIYNVYALSDGRLVTCSEDDALRVWDTDCFGSKDEQIPDLSITPQDPIETTDLNPIGEGLFAAVNYNYSKGQSPLVLVDAHKAEAKTINDVQFGSMNTPSIQRMNSNLIVLDGFCGVDLAQETIHLFDDAQDIQEAKNDPWRKRRFVPLSDRSWLTARLLCEETDDEKAILGGEISYWMRDLFDEFIEMGKITIHLSGFKQLLGITDKIFAVCGDEPSIQFWTIDDDDWPSETDIFENLGSLSPLTSATEDMLVLPEGQLAVWNKLGQMAIISVEGLQIVSTFDLKNELVSVVPDNNGSLVCACADGTVAFLNMDKGHLSLSYDPLKAATDLQAVVPYRENELLTFSKGGVVQRWNIKAGENVSIFPDLGLTFVSDMSKADGHSLFSVGITAHAGEDQSTWWGNQGLLYFDDDNQEFYLLESNQDRLALRDQSGEALCQWHFPRGADRDRNEPAAITPKGVLMTIAEGRLRRLQLMRSGEVGFDQFN